jgi:squalene cyclase
LNYGNSETVRKVVAWLRKDFVDGAGWWGRWASGYIYGTSAVVRALKSVGIDMRYDHQIRATVALFKSHQNPDGGWGEIGEFSDNPDYDPRKYAMRGPSHSALTAMALSALLDAGVPTNDSHVVAAVNYLTGHFGDPGDVLDKINRGELDDMRFTDRQQAGWNNSYGFFGFLPPQWYVEEITWSDLFPILALEEYMAAKEDARR